MTPRIRAQRGLTQRLAKRALAIEASCVDPTAEEADDDDNGNRPVVPRPLRRCRGSTEVAGVWTNG